MQGASMGPGEGPFTPRLTLLLIIRIPKEDQLHVALISFSLSFDQPWRGLVTANIRQPHTLLEEQAWILLALMMLWCFIIIHSSRINPATVL